MVALFPKSVDRPAAVASRMKGKFKGATSGRLMSPMSAVQIVQ